MKLVYDLREEIAQSGKEKELLNNNEWKTNYLNNIKKALSIPKGKDIK